MSTVSDRPQSGDAHFEAFIEVSSAMQNWIKGISLFSNETSSDALPDGALGFQATTASRLLSGFESLWSALGNIQPWLPIVAGLGSTREVAEILVSRERIICPTWHEASFEILLLAWEEFVEAASEPEDPDARATVCAADCRVSCERLDYRLRRWLPSRRVLDRLSARMERERSAVWIAIRSGAISCSDFLPLHGSATDGLDTELLAAVRGILAEKGKELKRSAIRSLVGCRGDRLTEIFRYLIAQGEYCPPR